MKLKLLAAAAVAALAIAHTASADVVKVGVFAEPYPPFTTPNAFGRWSGWEVDIINAICADQKMDCKIVPVAWDGIIPALTPGQIDATQVDSISLQAFLDSKGGSCCEVKGVVKDDPAILGSGVGPRKGDSALKAKFNKGIADILPMAPMKRSRRNTLISTSTVAKA